MNTIDSLYRQYCERAERVPKDLGIDPDELDRFLHGLQHDFDAATNPWDFALGVAGRLKGLPGDASAYLGGASGFVLPRHAVFPNVMHLGRICHDCRCRGRPEVLIREGRSPVEHPYNQEEIYALHSYAVRHKPSYQRGRRRRPENGGNVCQRQDI